MSRLEDGAKNPKKIAGEIAIDWIPVIGALFQFTRFIGEVGGDLTKGKLEKSVTIDGCASCFIFWFDRGEIVQIMGNNVTTKSKNPDVNIAPPNTQPTSGVVTVSKSEVK